MNDVTNMSKLQDEEFSRPISFLELQGQDQVRWVRQDLAAGDLGWNLRGWAGSSRRQARSFAWFRGEAGLQPHLRPRVDAFGAPRAPHCCLPPHSYTEECARQNRQWT